MGESSILRRIRVLCILVIFFLFFSFIFLPNGVLADSEPEISNVYHVPKYPLKGDEVTVYATITDADGINNVELGHCDEVSCYFNIPMTPLGDDVYSATIPWNNDWGNGTIIGYDFWVTDNGMNLTTSEYSYYFIVSEIELSTEMVDTTFVGEAIRLKGRALYNGNETAPVEHSNVTVKIVGTSIEYYSSTDGNGNFSKELVFESHGEFQINVTITNRTFAAYSEESLTAIDISYFSLNVQMTTCYPNQQMWVNGTARYSTGDPVVNSDVALRVNDTHISTIKTDSTGNYSVLITTPEELGQYILNVMVVNGSLVDYNEASFSVTELPLPDMALDSEDITLVSAYEAPLKDEEVSITVVVHNLGSANCMDVTVHFFDGFPNSPNLIGSETISHISIGNTETCTITWNTTYGTHEIWVFVDREGTIVESFEDNNNASLTIFVDKDFDGDGIGDQIDPDDDNDGYNDTVEISEDTDPLDSSSIPLDFDKDFIPDSTDPDIDGDGYNNNIDDFDYNPDEWLDTDSDGIGNNADEDDDDDGLLDIEEDKNQNGIVDEGETDPLDLDTDNDGVNDKEDYEPLNPSVWEKPSSTSWNWLIILISIIIIAVVIFVAIYTKLKKGGKKGD